jgi:iron complex outermembrane recepter protein
VSPGFSSVHKRLEFRPGAAQLVGVRQAGNDPSSRYLLKSSMDFGRWTLDATLRRIGDLPDPHADSYTELQARVGWRPNERFEIAVKGFNLLNSTHREYADPQGQLLRRSVLAEVRFTH